MKKVTNTRITSSKSSPSIGTYPSKQLKKQTDNTHKTREGTFYTIICNIKKAGQTKRRPYFIVKDGSNITPKPLHDSFYPSVGSDKMSLSIPPVKPQASSGRSTEINDSFSSYSLVHKSFTLRRASLSSYSLASPTTSDMAWSYSDEDSDTLSEGRAPSLFRLREDPPPRKAPDVTSFTVNLTVTQTLFHLQIPSLAASMSDEQGKVIAEANLQYEKSIKTTKTKTDTATQTVRVLPRNKNPFIVRNKRANASVLATTWDIYDCMPTLDTQRDSGFTIMEGEVKDNKEQKQRAKDVKDVIEYQGHTFSGKVLDHFMVLERLIQQKYYSDKQLLYSDVILQDPLSSNVKCNYTLSLLWTFKSELTRKRKVTSISWSSKIDNIVAVGYGKLNYNDNCDGLVCIWNVKQPDNPERSFTFEDPVTYVSFSHTKAQLLAVSFYSGLVLMVDITSRSLNIKASNQHYPLYYPVWQVHWVDTEDSRSSLSLITCGKNGRIYKYIKTKFFKSKKVMTIYRPHGNIQGVEVPRKCYPRKTLTCQNPSVEVLVCHPENPLIYLVGSSEGCVYTCSMNHHHNHISVFVAHHGPVYAIQFNPFCNKVFLTCGADWCIRIWAETIYEPLITLESGMAVVYNAVWNPLNSTVIVNTSDNLIRVWDIRRNTTKPKSTTESPSVNTVLQFTANSHNVCVGDDDGNVHIMSLAEMPFSPTFQEDVLVESILNALISQPALTQKLHRLGPPFDNSREFSYRDKMYRRLQHLHRYV